MNEKKLEKIKEQLHKIDTSVEILKVEVKRTCNRCDDLIETLEEKFVSQSEFKPIRTIVYGIIGLVLTAVGGAIVSLVIV